MRPAHSRDSAVVRDAAGELGQGRYCDTVSASRDRAAVGNTAGKSRDIFHNDSALRGYRTLAGNLDAAGNIAATVHQDAFPAGGGGDPSVVYDPARKHADTDDFDAGLSRDRAAVDDAADESRNAMEGRQADASTCRSRQDRATVGDAASEGRDVGEVDARSPRRDCAAVDNAAAGTRLAEHGDAFKEDALVRGCDFAAIADAASEGRDL